jgi:hypothetical protein
MTPNKYARPIFDIHGKYIGEVDVYSVLGAFETGHPAIDHAVKKLLCAGQRGVKSRGQDLREAIQAIERALAGHDSPEGANQ